LYCFFTSLVLRGSEDFALSYCSHFTAELILNVGVILFHQSNRTRESWAGVAAQLAAAGINVLTIDSRGHGESGGTEGGRKSRPPDQHVLAGILREGLQPEPAEPAVGLRSARPSL